MAGCSRGQGTGLGCKAGGRRMGSAGCDRLFAVCSLSDIIKPGQAVKRLSMRKPIQASQWNHHPRCQTPSLIHKNCLSIKHQRQYKSNAILDAMRSLHPVFGWEACSAGKGDPIRRHVPILPRFHPGFQTGANTPAIRRDFAAGVRSISLATGQQELSSRLGGRCGLNWRHGIGKSGWLGQRQEHRELLRCLDRVREIWRHIQQVASFQSARYARQGEFA